MDVRMPDGTIIKNVPEGVTRSQLQSRLSKAQGEQRRQSSRSMAGMLTDRLSSWIPFADEAAGVGGGIGTAMRNAVVAPFRDDVDFSPGDSFTKGYERDKARFESDVKAVKRRAPVASQAVDVLGIAGSMGRPGRSLLAGAPTLKGRVIQGAKAGATGGAIQGFADNEGVDRLGGAMLGGGVGAGFGAALPIAGEVAGKTYQGIKRMVRPEDGLSRQIVAQAIADSNLPPVAIGQAMEEAKARGTPLMLADMNENLRGLAGSVSRQPGPSRQLMRDAVTDRQMGQGERIRGAISRDLGPIADPLQASDDLINRARSSAAPLYDEAYAAPAVSSPELDAILQTPAGKGAVKRAFTIAANERREPSKMGFMVDDAGDVVLNPVNTEMHSRLAAARSEFDDAASALQSVKAKVSGGGSGNVASAQARVEDAKDMLVRASEELSGQATPGVAATSKGFSPQTLDYVKRGLDDLLEPYRNPVTGKLQLDESGRAINQVRAQLVSEIDRTNPAYKAARAAYAGPAKEREALELGRKALRMSPEELTRAAGRMTESQREQFALGFRTALSDSIDNRVDGSDKVTALLGSPKKRAAVSRIFGGRANFDRFVRTMTDERSANETYRAIATGSQTANRLADDALNNDPGLLEQAAGRMVQGARGGATGMLAEAIAAINDARKMGVGAPGKRIREEVAAILSETDPAVLREALKKASRDRVARKGTYRQVSRQYSGASAQVGRGAGALTPYLAQKPE